MSSKVLTLSNALSLSRGALAFLLLSESVVLRIVAIGGAMITDSIDGFIARKSGTVTRVGAILDPVMDKFFVLFALTILLAEGKLYLFEAGCLMARDFALITFGIVIALTGRWKTYEWKSLFWGKVSTALQLIVLGVLTINLSVPSIIYTTLAFTGAMAFIELCRRTPIKRQV
jgi:CDP-diacylglycerol--glycerol-3-phosphate 3-phosphatidyltransferase